MVKKTNLIATLGLVSGVGAIGIMNSDSVNFQSNMDLGSFRNANVIYTDSRIPNNEGTIDVIGGITHLLKNPELANSLNKSYFPLGGTIDDACHIAYNATELESSKGGNETLYRSVEEYVKTNIDDSDIGKDPLIGVNRHGRIETILNPVAIDTNSDTAVFEGISCQSLGHLPIPDGCEVWYDGTNTYRYDSRTGQFGGTQIFNLSDSPRTSECRKWR